MRYWDRHSPMRNCNVSWWSMIVQFPRPPTRQRRIFDRICPWRCHIWFCTRSKWEYPHSKLGYPVYRRRVECAWHNIAFFWLRRTTSGHPSQRIRIWLRTTWAWSLWLLLQRTRKLKLKTHSYMYTTHSSVSVQFCTFFLGASYSGWSCKKLDMVLMIYKAHILCLQIPQHKSANLAWMGPQMVIHNQ